MKFAFISSFFLGLASAGALLDISIGNSGTPVDSAEISFATPILNLVSILKKNQLPYNCPPVVAVVPSAGLTVSATKLDFTSANSLTLTVRLDCSYVSPTQQENLFITFQSNCAGTQKFVVVRKVNRRYKCSSQGDPHITTFDNGNLPSYATRKGSYYLVKPDSKINPTEVIVTHDFCGGFNTVTCNKAVAIRHLNSHIVIKIVDKKIVKVNVGNDIVITLQNNDPNKLLIRLSDDSTVSVELLTWVTSNTPKGDPYLNIDLDFVFDYNQKINGLCGNLDGVPEGEKTMEYYRLPSVVADRIFNRNIFTYTNTPLFKNHFACSEGNNCAALTKRQLQDEVIVSITGPLTNTGFCDSSIPDALMISTGNDEIDGKINIDRLAVEVARKNCIFDAAITGDARGTINGYLKSLQTSAAHELALLVKANSKDNEAVIAQLAQKYNLKF